MTGKWRSQIPMKGGKKSSFQPCGKDTLEFICKRLCCRDNFFFYCKQLTNINLLRPKRQLLLTIRQVSKTWRCLYLTWRVQLKYCSVLQTASPIGCPCVWDADVQRSQALWQNAPVIMAWSSTSSWPWSPAPGLATLTNRKPRARALSQAVFASPTEPAPHWDWGSSFRLVRSFSTCSLISEHLSWEDNFNCNDLKSTESKICGTNLNLLWEYVLYRKSEQRTSKMFSTISFKKCVSH